MLLSANGSTSHCPPCSRRSSLPLIRPLISALVYFSTLSNRGRKNDISVLCTQGLLTVLPFPFIRIAYLSHAVNPLFLFISNLLRLSASKYPNVSQLSFMYLPADSISYLLQIPARLFGQPGFATTWEGSQAKVNSLET